MALRTRKRSFSRRLAGDIVDLSWRVPVRNAAVAALLDRPWEPQAAVRTLIESWPVLAIPEVAAEVDHEVLRREPSFPERPTSQFLLEALRHEPVRLGGLLMRATDYVAQLHLRSLQTTLRTLELREFAQRLMRSEARVEEPVYNLAGSSKPDA